MVYIKDGLGNRVFAVPTETVEMDQKACVFIPRVLGAQVGQPLKFLNSDPMAHNVHGFAQKAKPWNISLSVKGTSRSVKVDKPESMIEIKCDIHPWMRAYVGVFDHPYFALSGADGSFTLKNVPPGEYTVEAWHERFGTRSQKVTVGAKEDESDRVCVYGRMRKKLSVVSPQSPKEKCHPSDVQREASPSEPTTDN